MIRVKEIKMVGLMAKIICKIALIISELRLKLKTVFNMMDIANNIYHANEEINSKIKYIC